MPTPTEESFLKDVSNHKVTIKLDSGVYRHLHCAQPGTSNAWFDIVTWPGFLAYSGDMGCFVFSRLKDMFEFFRTRPSDCPEKLYINTGYWAEKLEAVDRCGDSPGAEQFSPELFVSSVKEHFREWAEDRGLTEEEASPFQEALDDQILRCVDSDEHEARRALRDFSETFNKVELQFCDTWEWRFTEYTYRFIWCCYAIVWAIKQYDEAKDESERSIECNSCAD